VKWSVGDSHELQRVRRRLLAATDRDPSLRATAETLRLQDEAAQTERRAAATPRPRKYELVGIATSPAGSGAAKPVRGDESSKAP